jgi:hypothetical protein
VQSCSERRNPNFDLEMLEDLQDIMRWWHAHHRMTHPDCLAVQASHQYGERPDGERWRYHFRLALQPTFPRMSDQRLRTYHDDYPTPDAMDEWWTHIFNEWVVAPQGQMRGGRAEVFFFCGKFFRTRQAR